MQSAHGVQILAGRDHCRQGAHAAASAGVDDPSLSLLRPLPSARRAPHDAERRTLRSAAAPVDRSSGLLRSGPRARPESRDHASRRHPRRNGGVAFGDAESVRARLLCAEEQLRSRSLSGRRLCRILSQIPVSQHHRRRIAQRRSPAAGGLEEAESIDGCASPSRDFTLFHLPVRLREWPFQSPPVRDDHPLGRAAVSVVFRGLDVREAERRFRPSYPRPDTKLSRSGLECPRALCPAGIFTFCGRRVRLGMDIGFHAGHSDAVGRRRR